MFKKGDRVIALAPIDDIISKDATGICNKDQYDVVYVEVKWDDFDQGWGAGKAYWNVENKDIELYQEQPKSESKDVVPEYVECIKGYNTDLSINDFNVVGKIYEVESYNPKTEELKLKGFTGYITSIKFDGNSKGLSTDYKISTKAEFDLQNQLKVEENLVGRYLKTLVNNPVSIGMDIGEYLLVTSFNTDDAVYDVTRVRDNHPGFGIEVSDLLKFELMPIGFNPKSKVGENLVGRYIKALKDYPEGGPVKKDELGIITRINGINAYVDFPNHKGYYATFGSTSLYELMPIGFTPESEVKPEVKKLEVPYPIRSYKNFKECYTKLPIVTSVKRSNIVPLKLEKQKSLINLPTI